MFIDYVGYLPRPYLPQCRFWYQNGCCFFQLLVSYAVSGTDMAMPLPSTHFSVPYPVPASIMLLPVLKWAILLPVLTRAMLAPASTSTRLLRGTTPRSNPLQTAGSLLRTPYAVSGTEVRAMPISPTPCLVLRAMSPRISYAVPGTEARPMALQRAGRAQDLAGPGQSPMSYARS